MNESPQAPMDSGPRVPAVGHVMRRMTLRKWGGTEAVVHNLAARYEKRGTRSPVFCTSMLSNPGRENVAGVSVRRHRYVFPWFGLSTEDKRRLELKGGSPLAPGLFAALLREPGLSIVHTHVQLRLGGMARTVAKLRGIPYVVSIHGGILTTPAEQVEKMKEPFAGKPEWGRAFGMLLGSRHVLRDASAIICVDKSESGMLAAEYPKTRVEYIPNGVDTEQFNAADPELFRRDLGLPASARVIACVSRIDYQKNQLLLVRAFARIARTHPDHVLAIVGPVTVEEYRDRIVEVARAAGVGDRVYVIPGYPPGDPRLASAFAAAEMFVLPTDHEPFGIVILEAWASGCPVIATKVGGIPGFTTDERDILHVPKGDEEAMAAAIERLAADEGLRRQLGAAGKAASSGYDWSTIAGRYLDLYSELIQNHRA